MLAMTPPSMSRSVPVIKRACSPNKKAAASAISSLVPVRCGNGVHIGCLTRNDESCTTLGHYLSEGVYGIARYSTTVLQDLASFWN